MWCEILVPYDVDKRHLVTKYQRNRFSKTRLRSLNERLVVAAKDLLSWKLKWLQQQIFLTVEGLNEEKKGTELQESTLRINNNPFDKGPFKVMHQRIKNVNESAFLISSLSGYLHFCC